MFRNEKGFSSRRLRPDSEKTEDEGIAELKAEGWIIPDHLTWGTDELGKYIEVASSPSNEEPEDESPVIPKKEEDDDGNNVP
jgi:hypothetical protein